MLYVLCVCEWVIVVATATSADPRHLSLWQKVLSASLSGVIGQAIANPADVVKVRHIVMSCHVCVRVCNVGRMSHAMPCHAMDADPRDVDVMCCDVPALQVRLQADGRRRYLGLEPRYTGTIDAIRKIYQQAGILGFWTGCIPSLQRSALTAGGGLASYDHIKHWICNDTITIIPFT